ncbi:LuxR C-terminal-related transcriptional regulator [Aliiroseovarius sp.]|uniref:LuxR C-terminal-related transcriptional regulator n=1 Tax=Aliiroseovarius sp. TaxID=1872442 RepID=UPI002632C3CA|nr:LuxR C-terminal-related transcriptional regulator [Aliiroseovarius sp.]
MNEIAFLNAPIGLAILEDRVVRVANLRFGEMFGAPADEFADTPLARVYPTAQDYERIGARGLEVMRESGRYEDERVMRRLDGELFWCRVRGQSVTPDNPFRRGVWSFVDLSSERPVVELTPREREIAILTCQGQTSKEIGLELGLSYRTVEAHRARLLEKFGARKLPELVAKFSGMPL